jgi:hypothetical protein
MYEFIQLHRGSDVINPRKVYATAITEVKYNITTTSFAPLMFLDAPGNYKHSQNTTAVLDGCETWSFILREGHRLRFCENSSEEGVWTYERPNNERKLHNEELHILYVSPNTIAVIKSRRMRLVGSIART